MTAPPAQAAQAAATYAPADGARSREGTVKLAAAALKLGPKLLPFLKFLKSGKFLLLFASLAGYAWLWGPVFGAGALALIAVHETGHVWAMKKAGLKTKGMYFLPFMGAVAVVDQNLRSRWEEYWLTIMGPVFGLAGVLGVAAAWAATGHPILLALVWFGAFINLVNLLPILPLDGGRLLRSITLSAAGSRTVGFAVVAVVSAAAAGFALWAGFGLFALFALLGLWELHGDYKRTRTIRDWRDANPQLARIADEGTWLGPDGQPVVIPKVLEPMTPRRMLLGAGGALLLAAVLAAIWLWTIQATGMHELGELFG